MLQFFVNLNLAFECVTHFWSLYHSFVKLFHGNFDTTWFMPSQMNLTVGAFAQLLLLKLKFL